MSPITKLSDLPPEAFSKHDPSSDTTFYAMPRMVAHIDEGAIAAVTALYAEHLAPGDHVLDLMSSRYSHLPPMAGLRVTGHGMNAAELEANPALSDRLVQNLNEKPALPFGDATFDAALCCVSVQYLQDPAAVMREVRRTLKKGAPFIVTFSNRCFPTKAVALWHALPDAHARMSYVAMAMREAGFGAVEAHDVIPEGGPSDPLHAVIGQA